MPADLNRVTLVGRLTRDPEIKQVGSGTIASMRLAVNSRKKVGDSWEPVASYFDVTCFGRTAEAAGSFLVKGRRVGVDGRLQWREWEAKDGSRRQSVEVVAQEVFFLDSREDGGGAPKRVASNDDDLPF